MQRQFFGLSQIIKEKESSPSHTINRFHCSSIDDEPGEPAGLSKTKFTCLTATYLEQKTDRHVDKIILHVLNIFIIRVIQIKNI
jgi:hypothetical protein